ncbi:uncharacterized protein LOC121382673 [Gigantopelta aegis]|uniref:uncharacterized protein LOC121382673 n=1 Tax=Gigantopelta aegis TaxID=1735272 RepID=UPI001B889DFF|nr:uncharacterized protein LOC121382673 [Gigantopelta aegis]
MASENVTSFPNSTISPEPPNPVHDADDASTAPRMAFLALFIVVSFVGNTCIMIVIVPNKKYRRVALNVVILNMAVLNVYDSLANMTVVFGSLVSPGWQFDKLLCQFNTFSMNLVIVETVLTIFVLIIDRFIAIKATSYLYKKLTGSFKVIFVIVYTWIQSVGFSLPFFLGAIPSKFQHELNLCTISDPSSLVFICFTSVFCFLVPTIIIFILFLIMFKKAYKRRLAVRAKLAHQNYSAINSEQPQLLKHIAMAKYAGILFILWFIFECPYIVTTYIKQFQYSEEIKNNPGVDALSYSWLVDVTFLFVRFAFSSVLPVLTFLWRKDFWQTWKDTVLCRRSNSITDVDTLSGAVITSNLEKKDMDDHMLDVPSLRSKERAKVESSSALSFNIPVLFATANGIHVETSENDIFYTELESSRADEQNVVKGKKLDVVSSLEYIPPDTSDYDSDSDVDQYSISQPISTAHIEDRLVDSSTRSASQPQVQTEVNRKRKDLQFKSENIADVYGTDSGLDLSSIHRSCEANSPQRYLDLDKSSEGPSLDQNMRPHENGEVNSTNSRLDLSSMLVKSCVSTSCDCSDGEQYHQDTCSSGFTVNVSHGGGNGGRDAWIGMGDSEGEPCAESLPCCHAEHHHNDGVFSSIDTSAKRDANSIFPALYTEKDATLDMIQKESESANGDKSIENSRLSGVKKVNCCKECDSVDENLSCEGQILVHKPPLKLDPLSGVHDLNMRPKPVKTMSYLAGLIPDDSSAGTNGQSVQPGNYTESGTCPSITGKNTTQKKSCTSTSTDNKQSSLNRTIENETYTCIHTQVRGCSSTTEANRDNTTQPKLITVENKSCACYSPDGLELSTKGNNNTQKNNFCACNLASGVELFTKGDNNTQADESSRSTCRIQGTSDKLNPSLQKVNKKRKKHRRQRTSDSQKALLGSGSSSELQEMKSALVNNTQNKDSHQTLDSLFRHDNQTDGSYSSEGVRAISGNTVK